MSKIVILDGYTIHPNKEELKRFEALAPVTIYDRTPPELTVERIKDAEYVFTDSTYIGKQVFDQCPNIQWIGILATGINSVDIHYAIEKGIPVCNVPAYGSDIVAQHAFALLLYGCHQLNHYLPYVKSGDWQQDVNVPYWNQPVFSLAGKTIGIFGFGSIAKNSIRIAHSLGMKVVVCTAHPDEQYASERLCFVSKKELLACADVISLHCPLTEKNHGLIDQKAISQMKDGVILINTARGKLIDEEALAIALKEGKVAFAGLDVLSSEPPALDNPLLQAKNCYITPHAAWASTEARQRICVIATENLKAYLSGRLMNCVTLSQQNK